MRIIEYIKSLWQSESGLPPTRVSVAMPPVSAPKPELSCFIKGLILSMTRDKWECRDCNAVDHITKTREPGQWYMVSKGNVCVFLRDNRYVTIYDLDVSLNREEKACLVNAVRTIIDKSRAKMERYEKHCITEHARQEAAIRAPFEKLGCPDTSSLELPDELEAILARHAASPTAEEIAQMSPETQAYFAWVARALKTKEHLSLAKIAWLGDGDIDLVDAGVEWGRVNPKEVT